MKVVKKRSGTWNLVGCLVGLSLFCYEYLCNDMRGYSYIKNKSIAPLLYVQESVNSHLFTWHDFFQNKQLLLKRCDLLEAENHNLQEKLVALESEQIFKEEIQELHEYRMRYEHEASQLARVLLRHFDKEEHFLIIDQGLSHGIHLDDPVVYKNFLVGKVSDVHDAYSKVLLVTDTKCHVAVICAETKTPGIYQGLCDLDNGLIQHISHMQPLQTGDLILSAGEGLVFPYGFGVGTLVSFEQKGVQYYVNVKPLVDFKTLKYCYVLKK